MPPWTDTETNAQQNVGGALAVVDSMLSYAKESAGKPSESERALFAAAVVFIYGIWENYVEQLAVEIAAKVSANVPPERIPEPVQKALEKRPAWELAVAPGWRALWLKRVKEQALGDNEDSFGLNTAGAIQVETLLALAGVAKPFEGIPPKIFPKHLPEADKTFPTAVNSLVKLRGEIVHTGKVPDTLRKKHVLSWRTFVERAADKLDETARAQCKALLK